MQSVRRVRQALVVPKAQTPVSAIPRKRGRDANGATRFAARVTTMGGSALPQDYHKPYVPYRLPFNGRLSEEEKQILRKFGGAA